MERLETMPFKIEVGNQFKEVEREILVYNSSTKNYSIVRWPEKVDENTTEFIIPTPKDYLLITLAPMHAEIEKPCWVELPLRANMEFLQNEEKDVCFAPAEGRVRINIGKGPHTWQLKVTAPAPHGCRDFHDMDKDQYAMKLASRYQGEEDEEVPDDVTVGDNG